ALSQAFRQALKELGADMRVKLLIYKLFDRYVLSTLEELYAEANADLARGGAQAAHAGGAAMAGAGTDEVADPAAAELLQTLHGLFVARRGAVAPSSA